MSSVSAPVRAIRSAVLCAFIGAFTALATFPAQAETWRFALIGDTPYSDYERRELPRMIEAIAAEHVDFIAHVGDIKHSNAPCSDALFEDRRRLFDASPVPFILAPGDNEWTDCRRVVAGGHAPLERLAKLRELFFAGEHSLGQRRIALERQTDGFPEHQRWRLGPVLFLTLNIPGGNNHHRPSGAPGEEADRRTARALDWLREGFALARHEGLRGVAVLLQANPDFRAFANGMPWSGYRALLQAVRTESLAFPGETLFVHGDTHWQRIDRPLRDPASGGRIERFTRVETFGYPFMGWIKVFIDSEAPVLFRFETRGWPPPR